MTARSCHKSNPRPSYFVMIFLVKITITFLSIKDLEDISYEDFSNAKANRRRLTATWVAPAESASASLQVATQSSFPTVRVKSFLPTT